MERSEFDTRVASALEAARVLTVERMTRHSLPFSLPAWRRAVQASEQRTGWSASVEGYDQNSLRNSTIFYGLSEAINHSLALSLTDQARSLATYLNENTDLGTRPANFMPDETGEAGILPRCVIPLVNHYLESLKTVNAPDPALATRLADELYELAVSEETVHCYQLAVSGIAPKASYRHKRVSIRELTPYERGAFYDYRGLRVDVPTIPGSDFVIPVSMLRIVPVSLISVTTTRPKSERWDASTLPYRLALSFFLHDLDLSSTGILVGYDLPLWSPQGRAHQPFPLSERTGLDDKDLDEDTFRAIVDFADKIPPFGVSEDNARQIALSRTFRGCGMRVEGTGFLDFAIALEAVLLAGIEDELSYRFSLYGALFLRDELSPKETFARLKSIYRVRSGLVHGNKSKKIKPEEVSQATMDAPILAKAVIRKAIESGWPDQRALDETALS